MIDNGVTTITCKGCNTSTLVNNKDLELTKEHCCPACGSRMTDFELMNLKVYYSLMMRQMRLKGFVPKEKFDCRVCLWPEYEAKESAEIGNLEGGVDYGETD